MGNVRRKGGDRNKSVCEKSTQMVMSIAKLSTLDEFRINCHSSSYNCKSQRSKAASGEVYWQWQAEVPRIRYDLVQPVRSEKQGVSQEKCVDEMATEYIRRVRERNRFEAAKLLQGILPPPPAPHVLR